MYGCVNGFCKTFKDICLFFLRDANAKIGHFNHQFSTVCTAVEQLLFLHLANI